MNKTLSTGTQSIYKAVVSKLGNGYCTTEGMRGPVVKDVAPRFLSWGLQKISQGDQFFRTFSISNQNIASVSERWYGRDIASRVLLGNASPRHRCVVDMTRNNNGGLLRAIFDKYCILRKTLSIAKDGSSVATVYSRGTDWSSIAGLPNLSKKVVRDADGKLLREVYQARAEHQPGLIYTFVRDAKKGLKETKNKTKCMYTAKEGTGCEIFSRDFSIEKYNPAGNDRFLKNLESELLKNGWIKFLQRQFEYMCSKM